MTYLAFVVVCSFVMFIFNLWLHLYLGRECSFVKDGSVPCNFHIAPLTLFRPDCLEITLKT